MSQAKVEARTEAEAEVKAEAKSGSRYRAGVTVEAGPGTEVETKPGLDLTLKRRNCGLELSQGLAEAGTAADAEAVSRGETGSGTEDETKPGTGRCQNWSRTELKPRWRSDAWSRVKVDVGAIAIVIIAKATPNVVWT